MALSTLSAQPSVKDSCCPPPLPSNPPPPRLDYVYQVANICCTLTRCPHCRNPLTSAVCTLLSPRAPFRSDSDPSSKCFRERYDQRRHPGHWNYNCRVGELAQPSLSSHHLLRFVRSQHLTPSRVPSGLGAGPRKAKPQALSLGPMGWHDARPCSRLGHGKQWASRRWTEGEHPSGRNQGCKWNSRLPSELMHEFVAMSAAPSRSSHTNKPLLGSAFEKSSRGVPRGGPQLGGG